MRASPAIENMLMPAIYVQQLTRMFAHPDGVLEGTALSLDILNAPATQMSVRDMLCCVGNAMRIATTPGWYQQWAFRVAEQGQRRQMH